MAILARRIDRISEAPLEPGFLGGSHRAAMRVDPVAYVQNDPFFLLMDGNLQGGEAYAPMGEPHPHAGFETVTLFLEGAIRDRHEGGLLEAGDLQWMTAGSGVIHSEELETKGRLRILQLWLILPKADRKAAPSFHDVRFADLPVRRAPGVELRLYSGRSGDAVSKTRNHVPVTLADIRLEANASFEQDLPSTYNGFVFVLDGAVAVGANRELLRSNQLGWLDRPKTQGASTLRLTAGPAGARLVLYAGEPQGDPIVAHGPFLADTREDIARLFSDYRAGRFPRLSELGAHP